MLTEGLDDSGYEKLRDESIAMLGAGTADAVRIGLGSGIEFARQNHSHKSRTGNLTSAEHLYARVLNTDPRGATGELVNDTPYARFVEYPTRPHIIRPKAGHGVMGPLLPGQSRRAITDIGTHRIALRFQLGGQTVFRMFVNHPGTPGFPFMEPASWVAGRETTRWIENTVFVHVGSLWN
jgi:hypothetical protein